MTSTLKTSGNAAPSPSTETSAYEDSLVIYLDIIGFSDFVLNRDAASVKKVLDTLDDFEDKYRGKHSGWQFYRCSDTVILRVPLGGRAANAEWGWIGEALGWAAESQRTLLMVHQLMIRGGVVRGQSALTERQDVYGPALVRASELESGVAQLPRVVVAGDAVPREWKERFHAREWSEVVRLNERGPSYAHADKPEQGEIWFLDYLARSAILPDRPSDGWEDMLGLLRAHREAVLSYAKSGKSPEHFARCAWTLFLHNHAVHRALDDEDTDAAGAELDKLLIPEWAYADAVCSEVISAPPRMPV